MTDNDILNLAAEHGYGWVVNGEMVPFKADEDDGEHFLEMIRSVLSRAIPEGHVVVPKEPYAIEYGSSNGDGTWSPKIARYPLPSYEKPISEKPVTLLYAAAPANKEGK